MPNTIHAAVSIGIGNGAELSIDVRNRLYLTKGHDDGSLTYIQLVRGEVTKKNIDFIIECLGRMRIHAVD